MFAAKSLGNEHLHRSTDQFGPRVAEQLFRLGVDQHDLAVAVDDHHGVRRRLQESTKLGFDPFALGDVANGGRHQHALRRLDGAEADFSRKLGPVLAYTKKIDTRTHRAQAWPGEIPSAMGWVLLPVAGRNQHFHRLAHQLGPLVTEQSLCLPVDEQDAAVLADDDHRVGRSFEEGRQAGLDSRLDVQWRTRLLRPLVGHRLVFTQALAALRRDPSLRDPPAPCRLDGCPDLS